MSHPIHNSQSIRLKNYDYSQAGAYFITICTHDRECRFGTIVGAGLAPAQNNNSPAQMILNEFGIIACNEWEKLSARFPNVELDVFQIMPNHMHGIIVLNNVGATLAVAPDNPTDKPVGAGLAPALNETIVNDETGQPQGLPLQQLHTGDDNRATARVAPTTKPATVGDIIGAYKSLVTNACLDIWKLKRAGVNPAPYMGKLWQRDYYDHIIRNPQSYVNISNYIINNPAKWNEDKFYR